MRALTIHSATRAIWPRLCLGAAPLAVLAACAAQDDVASSSAAPMATSSASTASAATQPVPGGTVLWGSSITSMANQYQPRAGATAGTGASSWVPAAPPPAFVATGPAPEAPPGPGAGNRQPGAQAAAAPAARPAAAAARPAVPASDIVRPEAAESGSLAPELQAAAQPQQPAQPAAQAQRPAQPAAQPQQAALSAADVTKARQIFQNFSCGACHVLADAGGAGGIGPSLDNNPRLTREFTAGVIHDGRGAMPSFAGQISDPDIATLSAYIVQVSRK